MPHRQLNDDFLTMFEEIEEDLYGNQSLSKDPCRWVANGEEVIISGITITCGNFYLGSVPRTYYELAQNGPIGYKPSVLFGGSTLPEPSMIDINLYQFNSGYKYSRYEITARAYHQLNGGQRHAYLNWLATNNPSIADPPAFFLIYLCGIERRLFDEFDQISPSEIVTIFEKLILFRSLFAGIDVAGIFSKSESFSLVQSIEETICYVFYNCLDNPAIAAHKNNIAIQSNVVLSVLHKISSASISRQSIDPKTALIWALICRARNGTTFNEFGAEIADIFYSIFLESFPNGYHLELDNCCKLTIAGLRLNNSVSRIGRVIKSIYDFSDVLATTIDSTSVLDESIYSLRPFISFMCSVSTQKNMLVGQKLIDPRVKRNSPVNTFIDNFTSWAKKKVEQANGHCSFNDFWALTECEKPSRLLSLHVESFDHLLGRTGYIVIPGPSIGKKYSLLDSNMTLIKVDQGLDLAIDDISESCTQFIELVSWPVTVDENKSIRSARMDFLKRAILECDDLPISNRWILQHYSGHCIHFSNGAKLPSKKVLSKLSQDDIGIAKNLVLRTFLSSGYISPADLSCLEKFYKFIGVSTASLPGDIHDASTSKSSRLGARKSEFSLDINLLSQHEKETAEVQTLLSSIFSEEPENDVVDVNAMVPDLIHVADDKLPQDSPYLPGLSHELTGLLIELELRKSWSESEFDLLCESHSLMPFGAIDSINQWAIDSVGCILIESDSDIVIDFEILQEVKSLND